MCWYNCSAVNRGSNTENSVRLCSQRNKSTCILASNQDALWDMCKWSIGYCSAWWVDNCKFYLNGHFTNPFRKSCTPSMICDSWNKAKGFRSAVFLPCIILKLGGFRLTYWDLDVSSFFLSFFLLTMIASSSTCLIGYLPNLVRSIYGRMATKLMGLKIHLRSFKVTGVKNVNHGKNLKTAPIQNLIMSSCKH